jgi:hypothetical protein
MILGIPPAVSLKSLRLAAVVVPAVTAVPVKAKFSGAAAYSLEQVKSYPHPNELAAAAMGE